MKIMTKSYKQLDVTYLFKFNSVKIKLNKDESYYFNYESHISVQPVKQNDLLSINVQDIGQEKLALKEQYIA